MISCSVSITTCARSTARSAANRRSSASIEERKPRAGPPLKRSRRTTSLPSSLISVPSVLVFVTHATVGGCLGFRDLVDDLSGEPRLEAVVFRHAGGVVLLDATAHVGGVERGCRGRIHSILALAAHRSRLPTFQFDRDGASD